MNNLSIVQLNCRSIVCKLGDIKLLVYTQKPHIVAFSETWLQNRVPNFLNYSAEWQNRVGFGGGVGFLIRKGVQYQNLALTEYAGGHLEYQALNVKFGKDKSVTILNIYNPGKPVHKNEFSHYVKQLGKRYILIGDFNAHTKLLSSRCVRPNYTGRSLESLILENDVVLNNPVDFYTYMNPSTGKRSCLDLCLSSANIAPLIQLTRLQDVGSDHDPVGIVLEMEPIVVEKVYPQKWKTNDDNLSEFASKLSKSESIIYKPNDLNSIVVDFTKRIYDTAISTIARTSGNGRFKKQAVWWSSECSAAVAERRRAKRQLEKYPSKENILLYRQKTAIAKKVCLVSKWKSFHNYVESLAYDTPTATVWRKINSLKLNIYEETVIEEEGELITDPLAKANLFAQHLKVASKSGRHIVIDEFEQNLTRAILEGNDEEYNKEIKFGEMMAAISKCKNTSPGVDSIIGVMIKRLPMNILEEFMAIINQSFTTGVMPDCWKVGVVIPIFKPGKEKFKVQSYRPITLLSCMSKIMERVMQTRLQYWVDSNELLSKSQYGFCKGKSSMDIHIKLEHTIRKCLTSRKICIVVYVDLSSAFDVVWPQGLIWKLMEKNVKGRMLAWVYDYFYNRKLRVRVDGTYSDYVTIEAGTPQGAVLSPLLFNLMLADLPDQYGIDKLIYADDITITSCGLDISCVRKNMQHYLKKLEIWTKTWGMVINPKKKDLHSSLQEGVYSAQY